MRRPPPCVLRLTLSRLDRGRAGLLAGLRGTVPPRRLVALAARFALSSRERRFARRLLETHTQLWLFRCLQGAQAGDFAVVDMSAPWPAARRLRVLELKQGEDPGPLGPRALQVAAADRVARELARLGVVDAPRWSCWQGDGLALLATWRAA